MTTLEAGYSSYKEEKEQKTTKIMTKVEADYSSYQILAGLTIKPRSLKNVIEEFENNITLLTVQENLIDLGLGKMVFKGRPVVVKVRWAELRKDASC